MSFKDLIKVIKKYNPESNIELIMKAYSFASKKHLKQIRESGHPYITHLVGAAGILANLKTDDETIAACLLHDTLEDTNTAEEELKENFGEDILNLIKGVTKISKLVLPDFKERQVESIRKMLIASTKDIRVILIKLADRLNNMYSLKYFREEKQKRIAKETLEIYAPLAYRLGLFNIKWQLEDLSFRYLEPKIYQEIKSKVVKTRNERESEIKKIKSIIERELAKRNINAQVFGRAKSFYSIYKKITERNKTIEGMYDLIALRILVEKKQQCYEVLGIIHNLFKPVEGKIQDYIANPKPNMYQSLHTIILYNEDQVEIQILTKDMHLINEEGIAAHWRYKDKKSINDPEFEKKLGWIKEVINLKSNMGEDFLERLKIDLFLDHIFVFTPKNDIVELPKGATLLDFAYAVHSDLGNSCIGGKVNDKFVNLKHELKNTDQVEILVSKNQKPSREWLKFVISQRTKEKIAHYLRMQNEIPISNLRKMINEKNSLIKSETKSTFIKISECCDPIPNDPIIGLSTKNNKITVHKTNCSKLNTFSLKKVKVFWNDEIGLTVNIKVIASDRLGLFADVLKNISSLYLNIEKASAKTINKELGECNIKIKVNSLEDIKKIVDQIKKINDVRKVSLS